jgi:hypothetical protein
MLDDAAVPGIELSTLKTSFMRYALYIFTLVLICTNVIAQDKDVTELKKMNEEWIHSYPKKDTAMLNRIFADDFVLINPKGIRFIKKDVIDNIGKQQINFVNVDSAAVRILTKDVAIITAYTTFKLMDNGKELTGKNCYQDVYIKRKDRWQAVSAHVTLLDIQ